MGPDGVSASAGADHWGVLPAKLRPPRLRSDALARQAVVDVLLGTKAPCVVVRAGAGYGKTTAVRQWIDADVRRSAWVTIDQGDNDPVVLLRHVVRALHTIEAMPAVEATVAGRSPHIEGVVLPRWRRRWKTIGRRSSWCWTTCT